MNASFGEGTDLIIQKVLFISPKETYLLLCLHAIVKIGVSSSYYVFIVKISYYDCGIWSDVFQLWCHPLVITCDILSSSLAILAFQKDRDAELGAKWKHCAISQEPLQQPIVACELGRCVCVRMHVWTHACVCGRGDVLASSTP